MKLKDYLKRSGPRVAAVVVALVLVVALSSSLLGGRAGLLRNLTGDVSVPVKKAASAAVEWLEGIYGYIYQYDQLVAENNSLRAQLAEAQLAAVNAAELEEENSHLKELLNFRQSHEDYVMEPAKLISWSASNWSSSFTISKGSGNAAQEIAVGDCVITEYGALVGTVIELGDTWATVRTVVDSATNVGALVGQAQAAGMCIGDFALMKQQQLKLTYLAEGAQMVEGDAVLTSGKGENIPQGLVVGYIGDVASEAGGQTTYGVVDPACDLGTLSSVYIVTDFTIVE